MRQMKSMSNVYPAEWDTTSSPTTIYHNFNVVEVPPREEDDQTTYEYDQVQYTRDEYLLLMAKNADDRMSAAENAILALMDRGML